MNKLFLCISLLSLYAFGLSAQDSELITVKAGTQVAVYFPLSVRYRYPDFKPGMLIYKDGKISQGRFNYNLLTGEMEFIKLRDTLSIAGKKDINLITAAQDTFYFDKDYIEVIRSGKVRLGLAQRYRLTDIQRKGAYGMTDRNSSIDTYNSMSLSGKFYELVPSEDWVFKRSREYYLSDASGKFVQFTRKNVIDLYPSDKAAVKDYLKRNKPDFDSGDDLSVMADFLEKLRAKPGL